MLAHKPVGHLLVSALDRKLTGSFELIDVTGERMNIVVEGGLLARVSTTEPVVYLGHMLYELGCITAEQLSASLEVVAATGWLHGQALLRRGMIRPAELAEGLRQQRARKLLRAFTLSPRATFAFFPRVDFVGERPDDVPAADPLPLVWQGTRAHPPWEHVRAALSVLGGRRLRVTGSSDRLGLDEQEMAAAAKLEGGGLTLEAFVERSGLEAQRAELFAYFLAITRTAEIAEPVGVSDGEWQEGGPNRAAVNAHGSGVLVRKISFAMRLVGADTRALRVPTFIPMDEGPVAAMAAARPAPLQLGRKATPPKRASSVPPTLRSGGQPPAGASGPVSSEDRPHAVGRVERLKKLKAEQALPLAEMHLMLGEHEAAAACAREALGVAPELPAVRALVAFLEATTLKDEQEGQLRLLLGTLDAALVADDRCRRGRYYRAMVKRRLGDHVGAIADLRAAVALDPDDAEAVAELRAYEAAVAAGRLRPRAGRTLAGPPPSGKGIHSDAAPPSQSPRDSRPTSSDRAHKGKCRR